MMSADISEAVNDLLHIGYTFLEVNALSVMNAQDAAWRFLRSLDRDPRWSHTRAGEDEVDLGRVCKSHVQGFDEKSYFHFATDLQSYAPPPTLQQRAHLSLIHTLYLELKDLNRAIAKELVKRGVLPAGTAEAVVNTFQAAEAYNTSVLRFLHYPDVPGQNGAKAHYDKSFLTAHLGDKGGGLQVQNQAGEWEDVSPPQGMALIFCGVKAPYLSGGVLKPLLHRSTTVQGMPRTATVLFAHANIGFPVRDAKDAYERYYASV